jgi:hypothetical protein
MMHSYVHTYIPRYIRENQTNIAQLDKFGSSCIHSFLDCKTYASAVGTYIVMYFYIYVLLL